MKKLHYSIFINAPREKVWDIMLSDATYREWTTVFNPGGSYYEGDWTEGSKMLFLGPDDKGNVGGMVSMVAKSTPHEFVSLSHIGMIKDGVEDTTSPAVKEWIGAYENYTFTERDGGTELSADLQVMESFEEFMNDTWPLALQKLKAMVEK